MNEHHPKMGNMFVQHRLILHPPLIRCKLIDLIESPLCFGMDDFKCCPLDFWTKKKQTEFHLEKLDKSFCRNRKRKRTNVLFVSNVSSSNPSYLQGHYQLKQCIMWKTLLKWMIWGVSHIFGNTHVLFVSSLPPPTTKKV